MSLVWEVSWAVDTFGSDEQRQWYLPRLTTMELLGAYCLTEPGSGSDAASLKTIARRDGSDYLLTGSTWRSLANECAASHLVGCWRTGRHPHREVFPVVTD